MTTLNFQTPIGKIKYLAGETIVKPYTSIVPGGYPYIGWAIYYYSSIAGAAGHAGASKR
jgi:hypothetical protein